MSVHNLTASWKDGVVVVMWIPLSLTEARGFPLYTLSYTSNGDSSTGSVNTADSSVNIPGLDPQIGYSFTVQASTGNGNHKGPPTEGQCLHFSALDDVHLSIYSSILSNLFLDSFIHNTHRPLYVTCSKTGSI